MTRALLATLCCLTSLPVVAATPIRLWIMPCESRFTADDAAQRRQRLDAFWSEWQDLLDLTTAEFKALSVEESNEYLGQASALRQWREVFHDPGRGTGFLHDGLWYAIRIRYMGWEWTHWKASLEQAEATGRAPDLMEVGTTWIPFLATRRMIVATPEPAVGQYHRGLVEALRYEGQTWAYPRQVDARVLFSHAGLLEPLDEQPTWAGLNEVLRRAAPRGGRFAIPDTDQNALHTFAALVFSRQGSLFHVDAQRRLIPALAGELDRGLAFFRELPALEFVPAGEALGYRFASGRLAATVGGADMFLHLRNAHPEETTWHDWTQVHPLPACEDGQFLVWLGGSGLAVGSRYAQAARTERERVARHAAITHLAELVTQRAPLALQVACPAVQALRAERFRSFGKPGEAYLAVVDGGGRTRFVSYPPHPDLVDYETGEKNRRLMQAIGTALRGNPRAADRLHRRWNPVREALWSREGAILGAALLAVLLLLCALLALAWRQARAMQAESEALESLRLAAALPYLVGICHRHEAAVPGQPEGAAQPVGYGTLVAVNDGQTALLTAAHVLEEVNFRQQGMRIYRLVDRCAQVVPHTSAITQLPAQGCDPLCLLQGVFFQGVKGVPVSPDPPGGEICFGIAERMRQGVVFRTRCRGNTGRWQTNPSWETPGKGDSGMGLFTLSGADPFPLRLAAVFLGRDRKKGRRECYFGNLAGFAGLK